MKPTSIFVHNHGGSTDTVATPEALQTHRVKSLPNRKVVIDGTTCQPNYTPPDVSGEDVNRVANRSYESKLADPNGYGDPTEARHRTPRHNVPEEKTSNVSFANGQKTVSYDEGQNEPLRLKTMPGSVLSGPSFAPRRKTVGQRGNPNGTLKTAGSRPVKSEDEGTFVGDE